MTVAWHKTGQDNWTLSWPLKSVTMILQFLFIFTYLWGHRLYVGSQKTACKSQFSELASTTWVPGTETQVIRLSSKCFATWPISSAPDYIASCDKQDYTWHEIKDLEKGDDSVPSGTHVTTGSLWYCLQTWTWVPEMPAEYWNPEQTLSPDCGIFLYILGLECRE